MKFARRRRTTDCRLFFLIHFTEAKNRKNIEKVHESAARENQNKKKKVTQSVNSERNEHGGIK